MEKNDPNILRMHFAFAYSSLFLASIYTNTNTALTFSTARNLSNHLPDISKDELLTRNEIFEMSNFILVLFLPGNLEQPSF